MKTILNGITKENALFVLMLGMCPALAVTTTFESSYVFGICFTFVLLCSSILVTIFKRWLKGSIRIPMYILIIGIFITIIELFLKDYLPNLYQIFGIYLSLIVVNCIVLGRIMQVASKEKLKITILDALGIGMGYTFALSIIGFFREVLGTNTLTIMNAITPLTGYRAIYHIYPDNLMFPMNLFVTPAGAFITLGVILGIVNMFRKGEEK